MSEGIFFNICNNIKKYYVLIFQDKGADSSAERGDSTARHSVTRYRGQNAGHLHNVEGEEVRMKNDIGMGKTIYICLSLRFECSDSDRDREEVRQHELSQRGLAELVAMNTQPIIICDEGRTTRTLSRS